MTRKGVGASRAERFIQRGRVDLAPDRRAANAYVQRGTERQQEASRQVSSSSGSSVFDSSARHPNRVRRAST